MSLQAKQDESWMGRVHSTWGFGLALTYGLEDSFNVNTLALALIFFYFLIYIVRTKKTVILCGLLCMVVQGVTIALLIHGMFDIILSLESVYLFIKVFCAVLGMIFVIVGCLYFRDWLTLRRGKSKSELWIKQPNFLIENKGSPRIKFFFVSLLYCIFSVLFGAVIVLMSSFAVHDYPMTVILIDFISKEQFKVGEQAVLLYSTVYVISTFVLCVIAAVYSFNEHFRRHIEQAVSKVNIYLSAVFLSFGIGLLAAFYNM
ncbi:MAG: hypothetical protein KBD53_11585 [Candidatus Omnitrophica bacterium]|nr:hypothetical protein [Candidatus Omnitrophota bacterium]